MSKVVIKEETVYCYNTDVIRATKDTGTFGGPNQWHLEMKDRNGEWDTVQWMHVDSVERLLARPEPLTRYQED